MTTPDLERRLTNVLRDRAADAMERTNTEEKLSALLADGQSDLQGRHWRWAAGGLAAAAAAVAVWIGQGDDETTEPAPAPGADAAAIASSFVEAVYAYDLDGAEGLLSADVELVGWNWPEGSAWHEAVGTSLADLSCRAGTPSDAGTKVRCVFALNVMGSEQLGRGPYENTVYLTVVGDEITRAEESSYLRIDFDEEMWEPFSAWVARVHPADMQVMYTNSSRIEGRDNPTSLRLWEERVTEYVETQR